VADVLSLGRPGKIVCVGPDYHDHADESGMPIPTEPLLFGKFPNTFVGPGEPIVLPPASAHVGAEAELAVVIGATARDVARDHALDHVFGFTVANDVSARDLQLGDGQWLRGKGFDIGYFRDPRIALRPGDTVEVEVEGVGTLTDPVVE
jgi:2-keto-4-pentenoate hydratase/2-oxohepta-3-ene-1,7-dioic acid hydratase in catechol pathway